MSYFLRGHTKFEKNGDTPLITAAREGNVAACQALIAAGAQIDTKNEVFDDENGLLSFCARLNFDRVLLSQSALDLAREYDKEKRVKKMASLFSNNFINYTVRKFCLSIGANL
jgi:ankyrin repeat protein